MVVLGIIGTVFFWIGLIAGIIIIPFGFGGTFLIVIDVFLYGWATSFSDFSLGFVLLLLGIALFAELIEAVLGILVAKMVGGGRWGITGIIIGGFVGAVVGTPVTPVLGTLIGGFIGSFSGALIFEWIHQKKFKDAFRVGLGAFLGSLGGKTTKFIAALVMVVMVVIKIV